MSKKIYIASSWTNAEQAKGLAKILRGWGHEVDCFCEEDGRRTVFNWEELPDIHNMNGIAVLEEPRVKEAYIEDVRWLDWADTVVLLLPAGRSAHLEAGYGRGQGKRLVILGDFPIGEYDVMYLMVNALIRYGAEGWLNNLRYAVDPPMVEKVRVIGPCWNTAQFATRSGRVVACNCAACDGMSPSAVGYPPYHESCQCCVEKVMLKMETDGEAILRVWQEEEARKALKDAEKETAGIRTGDAMREENGNASPTT